MQTSDLRQRLQEELLGFAWSQWAQLGILADASRRDRWAMDPEALLAFTLPLARSDPRLFDEVLDWVRENGGLLSLQRLKAIARDPEAWSLAQAALAWAAAYTPALRSWRLRRDVVEGVRAEVLFRIQGQEAYVGEPDPTFLRFGWKRSRAEPSGRSRAPDPAAPINFAFRLRLIFGIGVRAEVVRILLTTEHPELTAREIAEWAGFSKRNVNEGLNDLIAAGLLTASWRGRERSVRIDRARWASFLGVGVRELPRFVDWVRLLPALLTILRWLDDDATVERTEYLRESAARQLLDQVRPELVLAGIEVPEDRGARGPEFWRSFERTVTACLRVLRPAS
jgi:DNA-binding transcriptional ArsR family regulator